MCLFFLRHTYLIIFKEILALVIAPCQSGNFVIFVGTFNFADLFPTRIKWTNPYHFYMALGQNSRPKPHLHEDGHGVPYPIFSNRSEWHAMPWLCSASNCSAPPIGLTQFPFPKPGVCLSKTSIQKPDQHHKKPSKTHQNKHINT